MYMLLLIPLGLLIWLVGSLMFLVSAFTVSVWWGIFCIFFPPTNVLFLLLNWKVAKRGFLVALAGLLLVLASIYKLSGWSDFDTFRPVTPVPPRQPLNTVHTRVIDPPGPASSRASPA